MQQAKRKGRGTRLDEPSNYCCGWSHRARQRGNSNDHSGAQTAWCSSVRAATSEHERSTECTQQVACRFAQLHSALLMAHLCPIMANCAHVVK